MKRITDQNFENIVYISHPYSGLKENEYKVADIILQLYKEYPNYLFLSPIHAFSYEYTKVDYKTGLNRCLWLLNKCNEMWTFGDYFNSKGCKAEIDYCKEHNIPYKIMKI